MNILINLKYLSRPLQFKFFIYDILFIGDWGLGIGDWAQSPIPNPQSPKNSITK